MNVRIYVRTYTTILDKICRASILYEFCNKYANHKKVMYKQKRKENQRK